jgi:CspA family cold shock protein
MNKRLAIGLIGLCSLLTMTSVATSQQSQPNKVDWSWSSKAFGVKIPVKVIETNYKIRGAYVWPDKGNYLLFVTFSNVSDEKDMPKPGERVEIEHVPSEVGDTLATVKGPNSTNYIGHKVAIVGKERNAVNSSTNVEKAGEKKDKQLAKGKVTWFNETKGFGYISSDGGLDVFVHYTSILTEGHKTLHDGQRVEFEIIQGPKGPQASNVRSLE